MENKVLNILFSVDDKEIKFIKTINDDPSTTQIMGYYVKDEWREARKYLIEYLKGYDVYNFLKFNDLDMIFEKRETEFEKVPFIFNSMF